MNSRKKRLIKIVLWTAGILSILFIALVVHIAVVTNPKDKPHYNVELGRIDFQQPVDSITADKLVSHIKKMDGVGKAVYNNQYHNIVFSYQLAKTSRQHVYESLISTYKVPAKRYVPSQTAVTAGACPVVNKNSVLKTLARQVQVHFL